MKEHIQRERLSDTEPIFELVIRIGRLLRLSWAATGTGLTIGLLFGALVAATAVDMVLPLGPFLRFLAFLLVVTPAMGVFLARVVWPLCRRLTYDLVARRIESHIPGINNRLVSCVDPVVRERAREHSLAFYHRLVAETNERIDDFNPGIVVDKACLRRAGAVAAVGVAAFSLALLLVPDRLPGALARIFAPLADIPPVSSATYSVLPGDVSVLRGDDLTFTVHIEKGEAQQLKLKIHGDDGRRTLWYDLQEQGPRLWKFTLSGFEYSFDYRVVGGGTWSKRRRVTLLNRPTITDLHTVLHYPDYMGATEPLVGRPQAADVTGPEGSEVEVMVQVQGNVAKGEIQRLEPSAKSASDNGDQKRDEMMVLESLPMQVLDNGTWSGKFLLTSNGFYRLEFRNQRGDASKKMQPARFIALPDNPPQVTMERPGTDLVLNESGKVPLVIAAYDDFGLSHVSISARPGETNQFVELSTKRYPVLQQSDTVVTTLDLSSMNVKVGECIRYRAAATDCKGQTVETREFLVRIAADQNAADQRLARFEKDRDSFIHSLGGLMGEQNTVRTKLGELAVKYAPLMEKIELAEAEMRPAPEELPEVLQPSTATNTVPQFPSIELDPDSAKALEALRAELRDLAGLQQKNTKLAGEFLTQMDRITEQGADLPMIPFQLVSQMRLLQQSFEQMAVGPIQDLASAIQQGADPKQIAPDLGRLRQLSDRLQSDLEAVVSRFQHLTSASNLMRDDPNQAIDQIQNDILRTRAGMMAHDLHNLHDLLADMAKEIKRLESQQERLLDTTETARESHLPKLESRQTGLEQESEPLLEFAQQLQSTEKLRKLRRRDPSFPMDPYIPDRGEYFVPPAEDDTEEPLSESKTEKPSAPSDSGAQKGESEEEEEPLFTPVLGGPKPKLDPRFADKRRPIKKTRKGRTAVISDARLEKLRSRQWKRLQELNMAQQSISSDQQSVDGMAEQLQQAMAVASARASRESASQLSELIQSHAMHQAMAMVGRMYQSGAQESAEQDRPHLPTWLSRFLSFSRGRGGAYYTTGATVDGDMADLDVTARTVILNMQPQLREELLEGMREEGPEAYRKFIQNYFKQLTKVKDSQ